MQIKFYSETAVIVESNPDSLAVYRQKLMQCHPIKRGERVAYVFEEYLDRLSVTLESFERPLRLGKIYMYNCRFDEEKNLISFLLYSCPSEGPAFLNPSEILYKAFNTNGNNIFYKCRKVIMAKNTIIKYESNDLEGKYFKEKIAGSDED